MVLAGIHGVKGVPLDLLCATFHHPNQESLARTCSLGHGCVVVIPPGYQIFGKFNRALDLDLSVRNAAAIEDYRADSGRPSPL